MKKLSMSVAAALILGLVAAPSAQADIICGPPGDPVFDPGSECKVDFSMNPAMTGGSALVKGYYQRGTITVEAPSFIKDSADDGQAVHLWVRYSYAEPFASGPYEESIATVSGVGATKDVQWSASFIEGLEARVCVGEGTANCSPWRG